MPDGPFEIFGVKLNLKDGTGGTHYHYKGVQLCAGGHSSKKSKRNPRHWMNLTRNVMVPGRSRPITINTLTILKFNNERVYI